ncbi:unnamed protein product, partial [Amoebophrya sp. A120]
NLLKHAATANPYEILVAPHGNNGVVSETNDTGAVEDGTGGKMKSLMHRNQKDHDEQQLSTTNSSQQPPAPPQPEELSAEQKSAFTSYLWGEDMLDRFLEEFDSSSITAKADDSTRRTKAPTVEVDVGASILLEHKEEVEDEDHEADVVMRDHDHQQDAAAGNSNGDALLAPSHQIQHTDATKTTTSSMAQQVQRDSLLENKTTDKEQRFNLLLEKDMGKSAAFGRRGHDSIYKPYNRKYLKQQTRQAIHMQQKWKEMDEAVKNQKWQPEKGVAVLDKEVAMKNHIFFKNNVNKDDPETVRKFCEDKVHMPDYDYSNGFQLQTFDIDHMRNHVLQKRLKKFEKVDKVQRPEFYSAPHAAEIVKQEMVEEARKKRVKESAAGARLKVDEEDPSTISAIKIKDALLDASSVVSGTKEELHVEESFLGDHEGTQSTTKVKVKVKQEASSASTPVRNPKRRKTEDNIVEQAAGDGDDDEAAEVSVFDVSQVDLSTIDVVGTAPNDLNMSGLVTPGSNRGGRRNKNRRSDQQDDRSSALSELNELSEIPAQSEFGMLEEHLWNMEYSDYPMGSPVPASAARSELSGFFALDESCSSPMPGGRPRGGDGEDKEQSSQLLPAEKSSRMISRSSVLGGDDDKNSMIDGGDEDQDKKNPFGLLSPKRENENDRNKIKLPTLLQPTPVPPNHESSQDLHVSGEEQGTGRVGARNFSARSFLDLGGEVENKNRFPNDDAEKREKRARLETFYKEMRQLKQKEEMQKMWREAVNNQLAKLQGNH